MPRLRFVSTVQGAATIELQESIITVGRDSDNIISIEDPNISKHHVLLIKDADTYKIFDLHSVNGTTVNGQRITAVTLKEGDAVRIGYLDLRYEIAVVAPAPIAPAGVPPVPTAPPAAPPSPGPVAKPTLGILTKPVSSPVPPSPPLPLPVPPKPDEPPARVSNLVPALPPTPVENNEPVVVPPPAAPTAPQKTTLGGLRPKPLLHSEPGAAITPPTVKPATQPAPLPTPPSPQAETAILTTTPPVPATPKKPALGTLRPKPLLRQEPPAVAAPAAAANSDTESTPPATEPPAPLADAPPATPPSGPRKFGAPPGASGTKFRLKRE